MKDLVIISHEPLTKRQASIYCINALREQGFSCQYWDVSQIFHPGLQLPDQSVDAIRIPTFEAFKQQLGSICIAQTLFIVDVFSTWKKRHFFRYLKEQGCFTIHIDFYANSDFLELPPGYAFWHSSWPKKGKELRLWGGNRLKWLYERRYHYKIYDVTVSSGKKQPTDYFINNPEYEVFREVKQMEREIAAPYLLFIDQYFPLHPDLGYVKEDVKGEAQAYQASLNRFFARLEQLYQKPVVIAAHPKAQYTTETFQGRQIRKYATTRLIKDADFVILHYSSSIASVLLFDKPFVIITSRSCEKSDRFRACIRRLAKKCRQEMVNIDHLQSNFTRSIRKVSSEIRREYIENYITLPTTADRTNAELLAEILKKIS